jgi:hypothetical protein
VLIISNTSKQASTAKQWLATANKDFLAALLIALIIVNLPDEQIYWSQNPTVSVFFIKQTISYSRFVQS